MGTLVVMSYNLYICTYSIHPHQHHFVDDLASLATGQESISLESILGTREELEQLDEEKESGSFETSISSSVFKPLSFTPTNVEPSDSPVYTATSPVYSPASPAYSPTSPAYSPAYKTTSISSSLAHVTATEAYNLPMSLEHRPMSPVYGTISKQRRASFDSLHSEDEFFGDLAENKLVNAFSDASYGVKDSVDQLVPAEADLYDDLFGTTESLELEELFADIPEKIVEMEGTVAIEHVQV